MPANSRWDLIRGLKGYASSCSSNSTVVHYFQEQIFKGLKVIHTEL